MSRVIDAQASAFLSFWYLVVNDKGVSPLLDFAGFSGTATRGTVLLYTTLSCLFALAAHVLHRAKLSRA